MGIATVPGAFGGPLLNVADVLFADPVEGASKGGGAIAAVPLMTPFD